MSNSNPEIFEQVMYVPHTEDGPYVWGVDRHLQMFSNVQEEVAQANAPDYMDSHIFFFAELSTSEPEN